MSVLRLVRFLLIFDSVQFHLTGEHVIGSKFIW
jgi:hypothetical protein